mmetsp:Transcript_40933/g.131640  ORF Transcript_40933/g.131640 Transcript_40933/m.131640 type:complete len:225 (+) Transcript_40933:95-769(+)
MAPPSAEELLQKGKERGLDPKSGAESFRPPPEVEAYFAELDRIGRAAAVTTDWWQRLLREDCRQGGGWVRDWPVHAKHPEVTEGYVHRDIAPLHYVMGRLSPMYIERAFSKDFKRATWAVYFGPYCSNGDQQIGVGNGGAISAVLDLVTANLATLHVRGRRCPCQGFSEWMLGWRKWRATRFIWEAHLATEPEKCSIHARPCWASRRRRARRAGRTAASSEPST